MKKALPERRQDHAVRRHDGCRQCARARRRASRKRSPAPRSRSSTSAPTAVDFRPRPRRNVEDTLTKYPDIDLLVGLWAYNTPQIYKAVKAAGKEGKVKIVGFDEDQQTLQGHRRRRHRRHRRAAALRVRLPVDDQAGEVYRGRQVGRAGQQADIIPTQVIDKSNVADFAKR